MMERTPRLSPEEVTRLFRASKREVLEVRLLGDLKRAGLPEPEQWYEFHKGRKWAFDFCWPEHMLAVEVEGGSESHGMTDKQGVTHKSRHLTAKGFQADCEKYGQAVLDGWRVLRFTGADVRKGRAVPVIKRALDQ